MPSACAARWLPRPCSCCDLWMKSSAGGFFVAAHWLILSRRSRWAAPLLRLLSCCSGELSAPSLAIWVVTARHPRLQAPLQVPSGQPPGARYTCASVPSGARNTCASVPSVALQHCTRESPLHCLRQYAHSEMTLVEGPQPGWANRYLSTEFCQLGPSRRWMPSFRTGTRTIT